MAKQAHSLTFYILTVILVFLFSQYGHTSGDHDHDHSSGGVARGKLVEEIAEGLSVTGKNNANKTVFAFKDIQSMFQRLGFTNCSSTQLTKNCQLCLTVSDLYNWHNISSGKLMTNEELKEILPTIVYFLMPVSSSGACNVTAIKVQKGFPVQGSAPVTPVYKLLVKDYGKGKSSLSEGSVETVLEKINNTIHHKLTEKKCFDVDEVIKGANVSEVSITDHEFEYVSAFIIWKLIGKHCITEHVSSLPEKDFFINQIFSEFGKNGVMSYINFVNLLTKLKIGKEEKKAVESHSGHDHRRRRSLDSQIEGKWTDIDGDTDTALKHERSRRSTSGHQTTAFAKKCYTTENVFKIYSYSKLTGINKNQFKDVCPALIQQIESGACAAATTTTTGHNKQKDWKPWVASLISVSLCSAASLIGIVAAPLNRKSYYSKVLTVFIAIAVGTLLGDGILHLFPHALGLHSHEGGKHVDIKSSDSYIWKAVVLFMGFFIFYLFEAVMHSLSEQGHSHGLGDTHQHIAALPTHKKEVKGPVELNARIESNENALKHTHLVKGTAGVHQCESTESLSYAPPTLESEKQIEAYTKAQEKLQEGEFTGQKPVFGRFKAIALMILFGDALHNFVDGLAIGAAFTESWPTGLYGGISTSIAILCHELPHELGDLAILLSSGLPIRHALLLNFISSLTAIVGAIVGVSVGQSLNALPWIFASAAGLFIYIALVDMLPELLHSRELRKSPNPTLFLQSFGILLGFLLMLLLALFEEDIKV